MNQQPNDIFCIYQCLAAFLKAQECFVNLRDEIQEKTNHFDMYKNRLIKYNFGLHGAEVENKSDGIYLVAGLEATRDDKEEVYWSVSITVTTEKIIVEGIITVSDENDPETIYWTVHKPVFTRIEHTSDPMQAASYILQFAQEVCAQSDFMNSPRS